MLHRHEEHQCGLLYLEANPDTLPLTCRQQAQFELVCVSFLIRSIMKWKCTHFSACRNSRPGRLVLQLTHCFSTNLIKVEFAHPCPLFLQTGALGPGRQEGVGPQSP